MKATAKTKFGRIYVEMIRAAVGYTLGGGLTTTQSFQAFYHRLLNVQTNLRNIDLLKAFVNSPITGFTAQRKAYRQALTTLSVSIMKSVQAYAIETSDIALAYEMKTSATQLRKKSFESFGAYIQQVIANVTPVVNDLAAYNITESNIAAWQNLLIQYQSFLATPRNQMSAHVAANANIQSLIRDSLIILHNQVDGMALSFKNAHPDYYRNYISSRKLIHTGHMSTQGRIHIKDVNGNPVTAGEVFLIGIDKNAFLNENGYALLDYIPFGTHDITVTTPSGSENYGAFTFKKGKSLTIHLTLGEFSGKTKSKTVVTEKDILETTEQK